MNMPRSHDVDEFSAPTGPLGRSESRLHLGGVLRPDATADLGLEQRWRGRREHPGARCRPRRPQPMGYSSPKNSSTVQVNSLPVWGSSGLGSARPVVPVLACQPAIALRSGREVYGLTLVSVRSPTQRPVSSSNWGVVRTSN